MAAERLACRPSPRVSSGGGFTLTELMIVMGLSGLVVAALLSIAQVHGQNEQQAQQGQQALENARGALEDIVQSAQSTAAWFSSTRVNGAAVAPLPAQQVYNRAPNMTPGDFAAIQVLDGAGLNGSDIVMLMPTEPGFHSGGGPLPPMPSNPPSPAMSTLTSKFDPSSTSIGIDALGPAGQQWAIGDYAVIVPVGFAGPVNSKTLWDFRTAYLVAVQSVGANALNVGNTDPVGGNPSIYPGGQVFRVRPVTYLIQSYFSTAINSTERTLVAIDKGPFADNGKGPFSLNPGLMPGAESLQVVAENIVDLQVALWYDCNGDGLVNEVGVAANDDEVVYNVAGENHLISTGAGCPAPALPGAAARNPTSAALLPSAAALNPVRISGMRISVVSRTSQQLDTLGPGRPPVENRPADPPVVAGADFSDPTTIPYRYRYRVQRTFVYFRNTALSQ